MMKKFKFEEMDTSIGFTYCVICKGLDVYNVLTESGQPKHYCKECKMITKVLTVNKQEYFKTFNLLRNTGIL